MNCALHLRKCPAVEFTARLEANVSCGNFKADPLPELWQFALELIGGVIATRVECLVSAPRCTVIPLTVIKLQLNRFRRILWVQVDIGE